MSFGQTEDCSIKKNKTIHFLNTLKCFKEFDYLQGAPLSMKYSSAKCVKLVYSLADKRLYYTNSRLYNFHYEFCVSALGYTGDVNRFNTDQYGDGYKREYLVANLNFYPAENKYVLEFFADDRISPEHIVRLYKCVKSSSYFGDRLYVFVNAEEMKQKLPEFKETLPFIYPEEVYRSVHYQALNKGEAYGILRKIKNYNTEKKNIGPEDIVLLRNVPADIPLISGVITDQFQTPLSHVNILCHNRGTPNAAINGSFESDWSDSLVGHLVHLEIRDDTFLIKKSSKEEAESYFKKRASALKPVRLSYDDKTSGLIDIKAISQKSVHVVGGKAAGLGELAKIKLLNENLPIPEDAFAIPFYYYLKHVETTEFYDTLELILKREDIRQNRKLLEDKLKHLRKFIKNKPVDPNLLNLVQARVRTSKNKAFRFRSSTNTEDVSNFNGAGLYASQTAIMGDTIKTIERAIQNVWASLWNLRAFQEREIFHIDHNQVAMGILVHKSFGEESANGVAITSNIYRPGFSGLVINVQKGEVSVVSPPDTVTCDQFIVNTARVKEDNDPSIEYITRSNLRPLEDVMSKKEILLLTKYLLAIKWHFYKKASIKDRGPYDDFSMDVEFKLETGTRKIVIKQARPYS